MPDSPSQRPEIAVLGTQSAYVIEGLARNFVIHKPFAATDPLVVRHQASLDRLFASKPAQAWHAN